ncbi:MAG: 2-C-methyl-D-erythritol 2,4-cyclodiphosphate synthase, partial [Syntrophaceae bacterium]|nr:2-C-methyl-D-erythritol 2,4-cyclodiphosphate synthase [Syntrophaceae bacterium]
ISSIKLLQKVYAMAGEQGFEVNNVDSTVILERPKLMGSMRDMAVNISKTLHISVDRVNVKAKTNEGMGFIGRDEGIAAFAVVTIREKDNT